MTRVHLSISDLVKEWSPAAFSLLELKNQPDLYTEEGLDIHSSSLKA